MPNPEGVIPSPEVNDVWRVTDMLSPEQLAYAEIATEMMSEKMQISKEFLRVITEVSDENVLSHFIIDASPNGQYVGNYNSIIERRELEPDWYTLVIAGRSVDTLAGCTESAYRAMVKSEKDRGVVLPDSVELSHLNEEPWTCTMLTGEGIADDGLIPVMSVTAGYADRVHFRPDRGGRSVRVRPVVPLTKS